MTKGRNAQSKKKEGEKREGRAGEREEMKLPGRWPNFFHLAVQPVHEPYGNDGDVGKTTVGTCKIRSP